MAGVEEVDVDRVLLQFGKFGRFQLLNYVALSLPVMISALYTVAYVFEAESLPYRCEVAVCGDVPAGSEYLPGWLPNAVPYQDGKPSACERYVPRRAGFNGTCSDKGYFSEKVERCEAWVFEPGHRSTILNEWNLTCDNNTWKLAFVGTINNIGLFIGMPLAGFLSDRFGRKLILFWAWTLCSVMGLLRSFAINYEMFLAFEFLDAFFGAGVYGAGFLLALEFVGPDSRVFATTVLSFLYSGGGVILGAIAWGVLDWRWYLRAIYLWGLACVPIIWFAPESVRWLASRGRYEEADRIIRRVAKMNRMQVADTIQSVRSQDGDQKVLDPPLDSEGGNEGGTASELLQTLKSKILFVRFLNCAYCWMANTFVYYGLSLNSVALAGNEYVNFMLSSAVELPANVLQMWAMETFGRRFSLSISMIVSGACCLSFLGVPEDMQWLQLTVYMIGKFAITMSFAIVYVFTAEMFPTRVRHSMVGYGSMFGRIGSTLAPQTPLLAVVHKDLPLALFGSVSLLSGILAVFFPETKDKPLPESIREAVEMGR